jgi:SAM-dependent methyltransferase
MESGFMSAVSARQFRAGSFFRSYQHRFLSENGHALNGTVIEIGAESQYGHHEHFPNAACYLATNISGDVNALVDATSIPFGTGSVDSLVCVSVLEHIFPVHAAVTEFARVVRPAGVLLLTVPFCYPVHDRQDYWRVTDQTLTGLPAKDFEVLRVTRLGGRVSTISELLQRPVGKYTKRYLPMKAFGFAFTALVGRFDQPDDSPLGYGVVARRLTHT